MDPKILKIFYPSTICIAGASAKEKSIGYELLKSIKSYGYKGTLYPVNPKADEILGYRCFKDVTEIPGQIDLAIVAVPKAFAGETIDKLLSKGAGSIILITAGFKEVGKEGAEAENKILEKIRSRNARMVGPNCMGVISTFKDIKLNATFVAEKPAEGRTAFLSQSGAVGAAVLNSLRETDIRFGHFISVGNKADISENDLLEFWQSDKNIDTVTLYLESFSNGEKFIELFIDGRITKPVIILKAGRTGAGMKAASSHTGAIGSSDRVVDAVLDQFGIIRAATLTDLFNTSKGFENFVPPAGNKIAVVTNAGGPAILTVDSLEKETLALAVLSDETKSRLREIVHPEGSVQNPVDLLPGADAEQFKKVNEIILHDKNVDAVISVFVEPVMIPAFDVVENINSIKADKPVFQVVMPLPEFWEAYREKSCYKTPLFRNAEEPAKVISNILFYSGKSKIKAERLAPKRPEIELDEISGMLSNQKTNSLLEQYELPLVGSIYVDAGEIIDNLAGINFPIVIKGISKYAVHKSEYNAVKLDLKNYDELGAARSSIIESFRENNILPEEFLIQPFIKPKHEILIGGFRDPSFGPVIMFGSGGKYVEAISDTSIKSAYLSKDDVDEIIDRTKIGKILKGVRSEKPVDFEKLKTMILSSGQMMLDNPRIVEFDFNPVIIADDDTIQIADARIKLK